MATNSTPVNNKKQKLTERERKIIAVVTHKLCPPFSQEWMAKTIFELKSRAHLNKIVKEFYPTEGGSK